MKPSDRRTINVGSSVPEAPSGQPSSTLSHSPSDGHPTRSAEPSRDSKSPTVSGDTAAWTCPACGATQPGEQDECPHCGIIVRKFLDRRLVDSDCRGVSGGWHEKSDTAATKTRITVVLSVLLSVLLGVVVIKWAVRGHGSHSTSAHVKLAGDLKRFTADDFQQQVVTASETYPVLIEFYASY